MAEVILQVLVDNLNSFIQGELALISNFRKEFEKLSSTFSTIQAVLEDAQEKQLKDKAVENWLQKLNVAACQVDDILDECKTKTETFKQSGCGQYHPKVISFRRKIGKRMKEIMEKLDAIAEERRKFHLREMVTLRQVATPVTDSSRRNDNISIPICKCSKPARLLTSSTEKNPGRRYFTCQLRRSKGGCDFFRWYDGVFSPRAIEVINELLRERKIDKEQLRFSKIGLQGKREPFSFEAIPRSWKPMMLVALVGFSSFLVGKLW